MRLEEISSAIMNLNDQDKKRVIVEVVPAIWQTVSMDETCIALLRELVDVATVSTYAEQHMGGI